MKPEGPSTCKYLAVQRLHCNSLRQKKIPFYPLATQKNENKSTQFIYWPRQNFGKNFKIKFHSFVEEADEWSGLSTFKSLKKSI
jgi:hypothetical protein